MYNPRQKVYFYVPFIIAPIFIVSWLLALEVLSSSNINTLLGFLSVIIIYLDNYGSPMLQSLRFLLWNWIFIWTQDFLSLIKSSKVYGGLSLCDSAFCGQDCHWPPIYIFLFIQSKWILNFIRAHWQSE